jgi:hypothetical protein
MEEPIRMTDRGPGKAGDALPDESELEPDALHGAIEPGDAGVGPNELEDEAAPNLLAEDTADRDTRDQPAASRRRNRRGLAPVAPVPPSSAARPDELPYIDDRLDKFWVGLIFVIFAAIIFAALAFGNGGFLTPAPSAEPTFPTESLNPSETIPLETVGPSESVAPSAGGSAPSGATSTAPAVSPLPSVTPAPVSSPAAPSPS